MKTLKHSCKKCVYFCEKSKECDLQMLPFLVEPDDSCDRFVADLD